MRSTEHSPSWGRIRLSILLATVAAFLLVPAAQAFAANGTAHFNIEGTGDGELSSKGAGEELFGAPFLEGNPYIECSYVGATETASGVCEDEMSSEEGLTATLVYAHPAPGSELAGWVIEESGLGNIFGCGVESFGPEAGKPTKYCMIGYEGEGVTSNAEVTAIFACETEGGCGGEPTKYPLTVSKPGAGSGTVTSTPAGINCGSECEAEFEEGEEVELSQSPASGSEFSGWSGACTGTGSCEVTMTEAREVSATFTPIPRTLTITEAGGGEGAVKCKFNGTGSPGACTSPQPNGTTVEVIAFAEAGSEFAGFSSGTGSASACTTSPCSFTLEANSALTATFDLQPTPEFELEINTDGSGEGEVECKVGAGPQEPCEAEYAEGAEVTLVPIAETGSEFVKWSEDCTGTGACELTMDADKSVTATFDEEEEQTPEFELTIAKAGTGSGTVTCNAGACAAEYPEGEEVTLAASAASGSTFSGWSGGGCSGTGSCVVTIEEDTTVTATFTANPKEEAKKEEVKPPPPTEGTAKAAATAKVKGGKASLKLTCSGGPCKGTIQLKAKVKQGTKTKNLVIGKASFSIAEGATATVKVKLSGPAKQELAKGKTLKAKASGAGVSASTVKLKQAKK